ncbi:Pantetheinase [Araneus ventricosus]|uniref:Pantetheinase n=1 Tax=Araneus ventricosus TaxID=182803 RepID=A0A4Y2SAT4_ARAVE|nr:Pantetheinase [Araneus ventricosus]
MESDEIKVLLLFAILHTSFAVSNGLDYYTAGVFEIKQVNGPWYSGQEIIKKNLDKYFLAAQVAKTHKVDIMIYPEEGLFPDIEANETWFINYAEDVPDPRGEFANPCDQPDKFQNSPILRNLSCLAKAHNFYVVADLIDVKKCEVKFMCDKYDIDHCRTNPKDCPEDGKFNFNTLVVFNRQGLLVARYHKRHLFFEQGIDVPRDFDNVYFQTEFGNFTVDICFDLLFSEVVKGAESSDVTGLAFPTWWFDHTPVFYFATPYQQAWSMTNKVNLLAANVHDPRLGSLGSGIYSAVEGALVYTHNPDGLSKLLISNVPNSTEYIPQDMSSFDTKFYYVSDDDTVTELKGEEPRNFRSECGENVLGNASKVITDYRCHQTEVQQYTFVKLVGTEGNINTCSNGFCCSLKYTAESMDETFYFGVSGSPLNFYQMFSFGVQSCFLARCEPVNGEDCRNYILKSSTIFRSVEIQGSFDTKHIYPFAINSDIHLTDKDEWNFDKTSIVYQNLRRKPLLFLCLYGRLYDKDKKLKDKMEK